MLIFSSVANARLLSRKAESGKILKVTHGIYTDDLETEIAVQVKAGAIDILNHLEVAGVIAYKSALEYPNFRGDEIVIIGDRKRDIELPGLTVRVFAGNEREKLPHFTSKLRIGTSESKILSVQSTERAILENLLPSRPAMKKSDPDIARERLDYLLRRGIAENGDPFRQSLLDRFGLVAGLTGTQDSLPEVRQIILEYRLPHSVIHDAGIQYDYRRSELFSGLAQMLAIRDPQNDFSADIRDDHEKDAVAFFESYFSNFIEGTEFEVDEAEKIVFDAGHQYERHEDGHDIRETFRVIRAEIDAAVDPSRNISGWAGASEYIRTIKAWHAAMFAHRRAGGMVVGEFKRLANRAGNTRFVAPDLVEGTLRLALSMSQDLSPGMSRAMFLKACFTEIHPFEDGNGRMSRIILNHELHEASQSRLIVPTVFRDDYITAMKAFSNGQALPYVRMINRLVMINRMIDWHQPVSRIKAELYDFNAFSSPEEGMWGVKINRKSDDEGKEIPSIRIR